MNGRLLDTFLELVRIASPSLSERTLAEHVEDLLVQIGCEVRFDSTAEATGSDTGNLFARLPGTGDGLRVILSAHLDTVGPCADVEPVVMDGVVRSAGETILGADDKAGIAVILEVLRRVVETGEPFPDIHVTLTVAEERGLLGAKHVDAADLEGDFCLVLDADGTPGGIVVSSPTHYTFRAEFHGKAAHAGVEPELGSSAVVMASNAISAMRLGRIDEESTANIGTVEGGAATNVVPAYVEVTGECRSHSTETVESLRAEMTERMMEAAAALRGTADVEWTKEYEGVRFAKDDPWLAVVSDACRDAGIEPSPYATGGGSDGNIFAEKGIPTLVLASGMRHVHGTDESIAVSDMESLAKIVFAVLRRARK